NFDFNGESDLDQEYTMDLMAPQPITQSGDIVEGAGFDNWARCCRRLVLHVRRRRRSHTVFRTASTLTKPEEDSKGRSLAESLRLLGSLITLINDARIAAGKGPIYSAALHLGLMRSRHPFSTYGNPEQLRLFLEQSAYHRWPKSMLLGHRPRPPRPGRHQSLPVFQHLICAPCREFDE
ncbi:hypothetical protein BDN70DRAFT_902427, partial [Pholiota conissans]